MPSLARHRWRSLSFLAPIAVLWLAFGLRMLDVTVRSLWYDEAVEYLTASVPPRFTRRSSRDGQLSTTPVLLFASPLAWGEHSIVPIWLRFLSEGFGLRYGLIFTSLLVLTLVGLVSKSLPRPLLLVGGLIFIGLVSVEFYALPNPTLSRWIRKGVSWMPVEQIQPVLDYWREKRHAAEKPFVYYGALPAFRYYLRMYGIDATREHSCGWPSPTHMRRSRATRCRGSRQNSVRRMHSVRTMPRFSCLSASSRLTQCFAQRSYART
jgi:hypothetical protein